MPQWRKGEITVSVLGSDLGQCGLYQNRQSSVNYAFRKRSGRPADDNDKLGNPCADLNSLAARVSRSLELEDRNMHFTLGIVD